MHFQFWKLLSNLFEEKQVIKTENEDSDFDFHFFNFFCWSSIKKSGRNCFEKVDKTSRVNQISLLLFFVLLRGPRLQTRKNHDLWNLILSSFLNSL